MKINNLVYPIMAISTPLAMFVWPYKTLNGDFGFQDFDAAYATIGSYIAVYGAFLGSWTYWYKFTNKK